jgi:D-3-phosphoglycerate dehydrogenase
MPRRQKEYQALDILLLDALMPEARAWLEARYAVAFCPELAQDPVALRQKAYKARAIVLPRKTLLSSELIDFMPQLKVVCRLHTGIDNADLASCRERGITVVHASSANLRSNAEYLLSSLLLLYRRGLVSSLLGRRVASAPLGRELHGSTVAILGLAPTAHILANMLHGLGVKLIGYDPVVPLVAPVWAHLKIEPVSLPEMIARADAVSVQMLYAPRFKDFIDHALLANCKPNQIWVGISRSELFEEHALAAALGDGRMEAFILDGASSSFAGPESPLMGIKNFFITPRLAPHTREAKLRSSWFVARRLHEALAAQSLEARAEAAALAMPIDVPLLAPPPQWGESDSRFAAGL